VGLRVGWVITSAWWRQLCYHVGDVFFGFGFLIRFPSFGAGKIEVISSEIRVPLNMLHEYQMHRKQKGCSVNAIFTSIVV